MPRLRICVLVLAACGPLSGDGGTDTTDTEEGPGMCEVLPGTAIHTATFTDATTHLYAPDQLVADQAFVYFADGRAIHRVPRCGGPAELLIADARPFNDGLALADGTLFWIAGDDGTVGPRILSAPAAGGAPVVLAEFAGYAHRLRVDGETVVWNTAVSGFPDESQLLAVPVDGGETRVLARHRHGWDFDLADGVVYAAGYLPESDPAASDRLLFALPVAGGPPSVLVEGFGDERPTGVEVGEHVYYFRTQGTDPMAIERVSRTGGAPRVLDLGGAALPGELLHAGGQLYGVHDSGAVVRITDGMPPDVLWTADAMAVAGPVFGDGGGLFIADSAVRCVEWYTDPSGEPPGMSCVRETIDVRVLSLGR
ncbi:hypothetical protein [Nannocystis bainbridge]|uniref:Uncharacterized protein n=1 Tax=Nannocystis bainbridge TaxID=2995303 RepID=A0ABT5DUC3_9BACT|nr:hypothetical protein [Nannocystis bainbridge]MDC0716750.1 hypothetical protein [Nannocystis bainbridge]